MKKILAMVVAMVMVLGMVGCGKSEAPAQSETEIVSNSVEVSTETESSNIPHSESDQTGKVEEEKEEEEKVIDKANAVATETIYFDMELLPLVQITLPNEQQDEILLDIPSEFRDGKVPDGTKMRCDVYYFESTETVEKVVGVDINTGKEIFEEGEITTYPYEYEISVAE